MILLNPGPVNLTETVRNAFMKEDMCHRDDRFFDIVKNCHDMLLELAKVPKKEYECIFLTSSGTGANEAMVSSLISPKYKGNEILVINNGVYGERLYNLCKIHGEVPHEDLRRIGEKINPEYLRNFLRGHPTIKALIIVHHETTTGLLNDFEEIKDIIKDFNLKVYVDAISSFGAIPINFKKYNIEALTCTSNKCLHGTPGLAFVICKKDILEESKNFKKTSMYFDLYNYYQLYQKRSFPFTPSIQTFYTLEQAIKETIEQTILGRETEYNERSNYIRDEFEKIGYKIMIPRENLTNVLTPFFLPKNIEYSKIYNLLKKEGFEIYAGQRKLSKIIFRIANMGNLKKEDLQRLVKIFKDAQFVKGE